MRRSAIALAKRAARAAPAQPLRASSSPLAFPRPTSTSMTASPLLRRFGSTLPPRSQAFATATKEHVEHLKSLLSSPNGVMSTLDGSATADDLQPFNDDWMNKYHGKSQIVVKPKTTQEVSEILKYCNEQGLAVVPQGGNTGLVGGSNPVHDEIILNLGNMAAIRSFDEVSGILQCDAGAILENVDNYLAEKGFIFPLDLGAKGSCQVGGNVATNAGGLRLLRYGSLHGTVLGLEVVLADGTVYDSMGGLRKDNTGFDLKQLFIGSEGTIGIITGVSILAPKRPTAMNVAVFSLNSYEDVQKVFNETKAGLGEILSAFEFFDKQAYELVKKHMKEGGEAERKVFETEGEFYVLVETGGSNNDHDEEKLQNLLEKLMENELIQDGVLAQDQTQFHSLWKLRELIPESAGKAGSVYKYDLSVPVPKMYSLVEKMRERLGEAGLWKEGGGGRIREVVGYGHIGDGNLHINICADKYDDEIEKVIEPYVYEIVAEERGSISAEHGLGVMKAPYIGYSKSPTSIELMKQVKKMFDPKGILNPYKYVVV
ncbi:D-lactate ferricytochrome c oxidoreductase [Naganishia albida]|nr:D-lactate ferricytochrome c oxidoreductase [Naganishia albida]